MSLAMPQVAKPFRAARAIFMPVSADPYRAPQPVAPDPYLAVWAVLRRRKRIASYFAVFYLAAAVVWVVPQSFPWAMLPSLVVMVVAATHLALACRVNALPCPHCGTSKSRWQTRDTCLGCGIRVDTPKSAVVGRGQAAAKASDCQSPGGDCR